MTFLERVTQWLFSKESELKKLFLVIDKELDNESLLSWKKGETVSSKKLPDRILELILDSNLNIFLLVDSDPKTFSFDVFCQLEFDVDFSEIVKKPLHVIRMGEYDFSDVDIIYLLKKEKEGKYGACIYRKK